MYSGSRGRGIVRPCIAAHTASTSQRSRAISPFLFSSGGCPTGVTNKTDVGCVDLLLGFPCLPWNNRLNPLLVPFETTRPVKWFCRRCVLSAGVNVAVKTGMVSRCRKVINVCRRSRGSIPHGTNQVLREIGKNSCGNVLYY